MTNGDDLDNSSNSLSITEHTITIPCKYIRPYQFLPFTFNIHRKEPLQSMVQDDRLVLQKSYISFWNMTSYEGGQFLTIDVKKNSSVKRIHIPLSKFKGKKASILQIMENFYYEQSPYKEGSLGDKLQFSVDKYSPLFILFFLGIIIIQLLPIFTPETLAALISCFETIKHFEVCFPELNPAILEMTM